MRIKDWLPGFIEGLGRTQWCGPQTVNIWLGAMMNLDPYPREQEAHAAAARLGEVHLVEPGEYLAALVEEILAARATAASPAAPDPSDREIAVAASKLCPHCGGSGLATIYHPRYDGTPTIEVEGKGGELVQIVARMAAHCSCPYGRWTRSRTEAAILKRVPCLVKTLATTRWTLEDPTAADAEVAAACQTWRETGDWRPLVDLMAARDGRAPSSPGENPALDRAMDRVMAGRRPR